MTRFRVILLTVVLCSMTFGAAAQNAPGLLHYQGRLTTIGGEQITAPVTVTFTFWDEPTTGVQLGGFSDADVVTLNADGLYATLIGDDPDNFIPGSIFLNAVVYLNVNVNGEDLAPRKRIVSVAYALQSNIAIYATSANTATEATHAATADTATSSSFASIAGAVEKIVADFVVDSGAGSITAGDVVSLLANGKVRSGSTQQTSPEYVFYSAGSAGCSVVTLSDTKFVIAFSDIDNSNYGTAVVGEVSGTTVTFGTPIIFNSGTSAIGYRSMIALSEAKVVITYSEL
jgi:hypothetical protein